MDDILNGFSDYELAIFSRHKLGEYMTGTQNKIKVYWYRRLSLC